MIGRNVLRLRGEMSQKDLAQQMRDRGWKWSQATVWSIEKGERPLRLAEAETLAGILDVDSPDKFLTVPLTYLAIDANSRFEDAQKGLIKAANAYEYRLFDLASIADEWAAAEGEAAVEPWVPEVDFTLGPLEELKRLMEIPDRDWFTSRDVRYKVRGRPQLGRRLRAYLGADDGKSEEAPAAEMFDGIPAERLEKENWTYNYEMPAQAFARFTKIIFSDESMSRG